MNKTTTWVVGIILIAAVAIIIWQAVDKKDVSTAGGPIITQNNANPNSQNAGKKMAFSEFIKQGGSYQCVVNQYVGDTESTGEVFIDNAKIRGDFTTQTNGMTINSSAIIKDGFAYTWTSASNKGWKVPVQAVEDGNMQAVVATYSWNTDQIGDYDCKPWTADQAKFITPATITFQEIKTQ